MQKTLSLEVARFSISFSQMRDELGGENTIFSHI
jgi:hypothetical protein